MFIPISPRPQPLPQRPERKILVQWDFSTPKRLLQREECVSEAEAADCFAEYLVYMDDVLKTPDTTHSPTAKADKAWHAHILCTQDYAAFCKAVHGKFIHHVPDLSSSRCAAAGGNGCSNKCNPSGACNDGTAPCGSSDRE